MKEVLRFMNQIEQFFSTPYTKPFIFPHAILDSPSQNLYVRAGTCDIYIYSFVVELSTTYSESNVIRVRRLYRTRRLCVSSREYSRFNGEHLLIDYIDGRRPPGTGRLFTAQALCRGCIVLVCIPEIGC